jgi:hypothetical protein
LFSAAGLLPGISEGLFLSQMKNNHDAQSTGHVQSIFNASFEVNKLINRKLRQKEEKQEGKKN